MTGSLSALPPEKKAMAMISTKTATMTVAMIRRWSEAGSGDKDSDMVKGRLGGILSKSSKKTSCGDFSAIAWHPKFS